MPAFPRLITDRLLLTQLTVDHLPALTRLANDRSVSDHVVNIPHPYTEINASLRLGYVAQGFREGSRYCFAILLGEEREFVGEVSLHERDRANRVAELGYWIGAPYRGRGYATEAVAAVLEFGFARAGYATVYATCKPGNAASEKVLENNGMHIFKENALQRAYRLDAPVGEQP
ncbi:RimJ/RimL family protein N-acetyltransferase [Lewinella marina]|uniref:GNAT family N-acetyltransferase n=1 Tax=Neolewinella marina TaxID=438751 RepID=A0A2G0CB49_9BACT|nr:GNAT family N-acetyltransferase [Neolewinella marina]NJB87746.1 RimJ/RimL family protein N-acetyltransferase [Neolewinella marina]PHK97219.1 GNAT family N-acetyltransferase [Neolewinella marina]